MRGSSWAFSRNRGSRSKYGNIKIELDGHKFDSKAEARYYQELVLRKAHGDIVDFQLQPVFELIPAFVDQTGYRHRPLTYRADFLVFKNGETEIVDVKGFKTREFTIKWKILKYMYREKGYTFTIVS